MAFVSWDTIMGVLHPTDVFKRRNDPQYWSGWVDDQGQTRQLSVTAVHLDEGGLELKIKDAAATYELKAVPKDATHTRVFFQGNEVKGGAMVFALKGSFGNPTRFGFDFRPIPINGHSARFNMRYDP